MLKKSNVIPIFFATDDNYVPFLAVSLTSLLENASESYEYRVYVLTTNLAEHHQDTLKEIVARSKLNASVEFISLKDELDKMEGLFHLRDYYSKETYYRFFIPNLFPNYNKVIYLDCDIVVLKDIAELYNTELGNNLVAAAPEEVMEEVDVFGNYVEKALGVNRHKYFNAGIMLMNTKEFRRQRIAEKFVDLSEHYVFRVTQDEDYLNVLCKDKLVLLDLGWNKTAFKNPKFNDDDLKLVHYKINWKPWHYEGIEYENYFWDYAKKNGLEEKLLQMRADYGQDKKERDSYAYLRLSSWAKEDAENPNNYWNTVSSTISKGKRNTRFNRTMRMLRVARIIQIRKLSRLARGTYNLWKQRRVEIA